MKLSRVYFAVSLVVFGCTMQSEYVFAAACPSGQECVTIGDTVVSGPPGSRCQASGNVAGYCYASSQITKPATTKAITAATTPAVQKAVTADPATATTDAANNQNGSATTDATKTVADTSGVTKNPATTGADTPTVTSGTQYTQLENIPGYEGRNKTFPEYVVTIYNFALWIVGISAMFMLTVGGFMYLTSAGNTSSANTAKGLIKDALIGLVLGLSAWLIVNTINPDLTTMNVSGLTSGTPTPSAAGGNAPTKVTSADGQYSHSDAVAALKQAGIGVHSTGGCSDQNTVGCTSLNGIPKDAIDKVIALKESCGCDFDVTGGTEVGHSSHGTGLSVLDVTQDQKLGDYLNANKSNLSSLGINKICSTSAWQRVSYNCGGYVEQASHFHLAF